LFTAASYALYLITQRKVQGMDRMVVLGVQVLFSILVLSMFYSSLVPALPTDLHFYSVLMFIAVVFTIFPLFLNLYALNRINSATIGILMYINPLLNFLLAMTVFKESINPIQMAGYGVIMVALVLFNIPNFGKIKNAYQASRPR
jgi:chloramphenicol-sensitive protein RarD